MVWVCGAGERLDKVKETALGGGFALCCAIEGSADLRHQARRVVSRLVCLASRLAVVAALRIRIEQTPNRTAPVPCLVRLHCSVTVGTG